MTKRNLAFLIIPVIWMVVIWGFVGFKEYQLAKGREVVLQTVPVDPRDIFRGEYVTLRYKISEIDIYLDPKWDDSYKLRVGDQIYIVLTDEGELQTLDNVRYSSLGGGSNSPIYYKNKPEEGSQLFIKGIIKKLEPMQPQNPKTFREAIEAGVNKNTRLTIEYGIESYFVEEGQGREIENRARNGDLKVRVVIDREGNATIKSLDNP